VGHTRKLSYRYAERARAEQQAGRIPLNDGDTLEGRRVVISTDGGRTRLREKKRGPKTKKDRTRFRGAWREPKLLIIYVVDAQGKQEKRALRAFPWLTLTLICNNQASP
jgi:hypothetical protein